MAITPISSPYNIVVNMDFGLDVTITGNPTDVAVTGLVQGFYYDWDSNAGILRIRGTADKLLSSETATIIADDEELMFNYGVIPAIPVITPPGRQPIVKGISNEIIVPVSGNVSNVSLDTLWLGLDVGEHENGIRIYGDVPRDANFVRTNGTMRLRVDNGTEMGEATTDIDFDITFGIGTYDGPAVTAQLEVRFRKPAPTGVKLFVSAERTKVSRRIIEAKAEIKLSDNTLIATGTGKVMPVDDSFAP